MADRLPAAADKVIEAWYGLGECKTLRELEDATTALDKAVANLEKVRGSK